MDFKRKKIVFLASRCFTRKYNISFFLPLGFFKKKKKLPVYRTWISNPRLNVKRRPDLKVVEGASRCILVSLTVEVVAL